MKKKILPIVTICMIAGLLPACQKQGGTPGGNTSIVEQEYTLTFNYCNGTDIVRKTGKKGEEIDLPAGKNAGGKMFVGWSTEYDATKKFGNVDRVVTGKKVTVGESNQVYYAAYNTVPDHTEAEVEAYMNGLKQSSVANHLYYHYYRFKGDYTDWDVWAWAYKPDAGEGAKFDWKNDVDNFGGAYVDIDLNGTYDGGWNSYTKVMGGTVVKYQGAEQIGLQIVQTSTRQSSSGFWVNDGSNLYISLADYALPLNGGGTAYHVFVVQDNVQDPKTAPSTSNADPFDGDDGSNVTYGNNAYDNINWSSTPAKTATAEDFKSVGVGYQIMVSSFADSDGDGFGDIYGITCKLDYLEALGVKALWLTPIQLSDSYHGYDITDYEMVDPKFGSTASTAGVQNGGVVTSETALADYRELITAAHAKGMKVVMDLVLNHTSTSNKWFVRSANLDANYRGYYQWGNHNTQSAIREEKSWYRYGDHPYSFYAKFGSGMPELNYSYKATRDAVEDMSAWWVREVGVDGFRLDAVKHIYMADETTTRSGDTIIKDQAAAGDYSSNLTKNLHFFRELKANVSQKAGKNVFFVGENFDGHAYQVSPYYEAFDSMFDFYSYFNLTSNAATGVSGNQHGTASGFFTSTTGTYNPQIGSDVLNSDSALSIAKGKKWNFPTVYSVYNEYRGDTSLPGLFTSNHDIARVINRVAGTGTGDGIQAQGTIGTSNYAKYERSADLVKFAELMMPGLTWVYYGDEIGMTGNFPHGTDAQSDYADLWYRQPMKWTMTQDGDFMTDYYVTGSKMKVQWDGVNSSDVVVPAMQQMNDANSEFGHMKDFIKIKTDGSDAAKALILGSIEYVYYCNGTGCDNVLQFKRVYNGTTVKVIVNFSGTTFSSTANGFSSGTVLASYGGATVNNIPGYSAIVVKA
ncbi:MAG: hypothetical protein J5511_01255 [Bacilli bacterium]|nr:hypothetical protein [Bacilli bacterium]